MSTSLIRGLRLDGVSGSFHLLQGFNTFASNSQRDLPVTPPVHWHLHYYIDHVVIELVRGFITLLHLFVIDML